MNNRFIFIIATVIALTGTAQTLGDEVLLKSDFELVNVDSVPEELMVLAGEFSVKEIDGNRALELPGDPLEDFGALFGPTESESIAVRARVHSESSKRLAPRFGIGLGGVSGYKLLVAPSQNRLQLLKDQEAVASAPFEWKSGTWTALHLQIRKVSESKWIIEGRAWVDGTPEPKDWPISHEVSEARACGQGLDLGSPLFGKVNSLRRSKGHLAATLIPNSRSGRSSAKAACSQRKRSEEHVARPRCRGTRLTAARPRVWSSASA